MKVSQATKAPDGNPNGIYDELGGVWKDKKKTGTPNGLVAAQEHRQT